MLSFPFRFVGWTLGGQDGLRYSCDLLRRVSENTPLRQLGE
jgi:hypothetical protein